MFLNELSKEEQKVFLDLAYTMIYADEVLTTEEEAAMQLYEQECGISVSEAKKVNFDEAILYFGDKPQMTKNKIFVELLGLALIDDDYAIEEKNIIDKAKETLGITNKRMEELIELLKRTKEVYVDMNRWLVG